MKDPKALLAVHFAKGFASFIQYLHDNKEKVLDNGSFKKYVSQQLGSTGVNADAKTQKLVGVWDEVNHMTYSKEDALIEALQKTNKEKFETLKNIVNTEIVKNKAVKADLKNLDSSRVIKVSYTDNSHVDVDFYTQKMKPYNDAFLQSARDLIEGKPEEKISLQQDGKKLLSNFSKVTPKKLLVDTQSVATGETPSSQSVCQMQAQSQYHYNYQ